ncbi:MAG: sporulation protein YqfD [Oscillospiraceae bacterium]|nr:sporulation protein YqfD [Oscillospiraceae bacterium]
MLQKALHLAEGTVTLRVESPYPERFINLCSANGIRFWDLKWISEQAFSLKFTRRDYGRLRRLTGKLECSYRIEKRKGFVFFARRFRRRQVLLAGLAAAFIMTVMGSFFVWDIVVEGNETVGEEEILRALEECGVTYGTFGLGIDSQMLRNRMLLKVPQLSYLAVNVSGCRAYVQVWSGWKRPKWWMKPPPVTLWRRKAAL